jgi:hypothetical protein
LGEEWGGLLGGCSVVTPCYDSLSKSYVAKKKKKKKKKKRRKREKE